MIHRWGYIRLGWHPADVHAPLDPERRVRRGPHRARRRLCVRVLAVFLLLLTGSLMAGSGRTLVDAHLHYTGTDAAELDAAEIVALFDRNRVEAAVVTGTPAWPVERLHAAAPERVLPFLGVYRRPEDKRNWMHDASLPARVEAALDRAPIYRGIGELHIFAPDRDSPVLAALVDIAARRDLALLVHGDAEVIDAIFARDPDATVLWAHLGTDPRPEALRPVLARHSRLHVDTSVRDERFVDADGRLLPGWRRFFIDHDKRVLVGVDTYWTRRWHEYGTEAAQIRAWLDQLPPDVADRIAHGNARRLFGLGGH